LRRYLLEEAYEVLDAIDKEDMLALTEELGDVLLQIVLHAQIAIDNSEFNMSDVLRTINQKMVRRHPHVFSTTTVEDANEVVVNWQAIKQQEKAENGKGNESLLDGVPKTMPALMLAYEYQSRAAKAGFDWDEIGDVRAKIIEELDEVLDAKTDAERADEIGDVLFVMVNWARWLKVEPETALRETGAKFYRRFNFIEQRVRETGNPMSKFSLADLETFWDEAKSNGL
jgi:tetrapyrrole methylase family protein/MazG family protein